MEFNLAQKLAIGYIRARINIMALAFPKRAAKKAFAIFCTPMRRTKPKASRIFSKGQPLSFRLEDRIVRGHRWLPQHTSGTPLKKVLIAHGYESASSNFGQYVGGLLKKGYEVLAFDAPAHGESDGRKITLPLYAQAIRSIHERYGPVQSFMGHSFGGLALCLFLETLPAGGADRLVLIAPMTEATRAIDSFFQLLQINPELRPEFDRLILEKSGFPPTHFSIRRAMHHIHADTLWVQDEDDQVTPLAAALPVKEDGHPNLRFLITRGLGHRKVYRDEDVVRQVVDFL